MKLKVEISFSLHSPAHTTADRTSFGIDKAIYLDHWNEKPSIPATSLKGVFRHNVERILKSKDKYVCTAPNPEYMCNDKDSACIACKFFGFPRGKSPLFFEDVIIEEPMKDSRIGVGIERRRKIAKEDHLFSYELGFGKKLSTEIKGFFSQRDDAITACALLYIGAKAGIAIGGGKSRGTGWIRLDEFKAKIDEKEVLMEEINKKIKEVLL